MIRLAKTFKRSPNIALALFLVFWQLMVPLTIIMATPDVASAVSGCVNDTAGANDEPGQKDLNRLCVNESGLPTSIAVTWNWDSLGTSGNNTMDACALFDSDGDTKINYAACVTTNNVPATFGSLTLYSCGDDKIDRCTSPNPTIPGPYTSSCTVNQQNTDPFPAGNFSPTDTVATCTFVLDDFNVNINSLTLTDVCSYPSQQPNSDPSDCVIIQNEPVALIEVIKNVVPDGNPGLFNLTVDGPANNDTTTVTDRGDNGTTGVINLSPPNNGGTATVSETAGTGTNLANYSSSITCVNRATNAVVAQGAGTSLAVPVSDGSNIVCTITNTASGSITIVKNAIPDSTQNFDFTSNAAGFANFQLDDEAGANTDAVPESITIPNLSAGTYNFTEAQTAGWYLDQIDCPNISETQNTSNGTLSLTITAGQNITCTFTNRQIGQIIVTKQTNPDNDPTQFTINASPASGVIGNAEQTITDNASVVYSVKHGTYNVNETVPAGWTMSSNSCSQLTIDGNTPLVNGIPTLTCTINNTKHATLRILKDALPNDAADFGFTTTGLGGAAFSLDDDSDNTLSNTQVFNGLLPGAYSVTESSVSGWALTGLSCDTNNFTVAGSTVNVNLAAGQVSSCTFVNTKLVSISGTKYAVSATGTIGSGLEGWTIFIDGNNNGILDPGELSSTTDVDGNYSFTNLLPGSFTLNEVLLAGWTQIFKPAPFTLNAGETAVDKDFGNFQNGSIGGFKWNDVNGNGVYDNEPKLDGWTITLLNDNNDQDTDLNNQVAQTVTAGGGNYSFTNLAPGTYAVCETQQAGWSQTFPLGNTCHQVVIDQSGETNSATNFGNQGRGSIQVIKNVDNNGDGQVDQAGATDWSWDIDGSGNFATGSTQSVAAGSYTVSEDQKAGYHITSSSCSGETPGATPSEQISVNVAPGEAVVCTFVNTRDTGTITVNKALLPNTDSGLFNLEINGETAGTGANVGDGGTTGVVSVVTGQYTIGESAGTSTNLANYSIQYTCLNGRTVVASGSTSTSTTFNVNTGDAIVCTITNTRLGKIIIQKETDPDGHAQSFNFSASYDGDGFSLSDGQQNDSGDLLPGSYSVSENTPAGWDLTSAVCSDQSDPSNISLQAGETVTCTFTNTQDANIVVVKQTNPDGSSQSFGFNASYDNDGFSLSDGQSNNSGDLDPGTYSISENVPAGWDLDSATCDDGSTPGSVSLQAGETVTCTFTNEQDAHIIVVKQTDPDGSSEVFNFTASYDGDGFSLSDGQQNDSGDLDPGIYSVSEVVPGGWQLKNAACSDQSDSSAISLSAGETVTCTFNNEQDAHIVVVKQTLPDGDPQTFDFTASYDNDGFTLSDGASNNSGDLDPGTYSVAESVPTGWDLGSVVCSDQSDPSNISLQAGETVTCTFTNHKRASVIVTKYNDYNRNGEKDADEPVLPGWEFTLEGNNPCDLIPLTATDEINSVEDLICAAETNSTTQTTGADGTTTFNNVQSNKIHTLSETLQPEWTLSDMDCSSTIEEREISAQDNESILILPDPGEIVTCAVGNYQEPALEIAKTNNRPNPTTVGDTVTYTLVVSTPENSGAVYNTTVLDLPPENFEYVPGSWTANSSLRGDLKAAGVTTEPTYASPGSWILGRLLPGETVTLTYRATIGNSVITGLYPDFAFASGCPTTESCTTSSPNVVLANVSTGSTTPFVGTQVAINLPAVLGANTTRLVNTGAADIWRNLLIAGLIILVTTATFLATRTTKGGRS